METSVPQVSQSADIDNIRQAASPDEMLSDVCEMARKVENPCRLECSPGKPSPRLPSRASNVEGWSCCASSPAPYPPLDNINDKILARITCIENKLDEFLAMLSGLAEGGAHTPSVLGQSISFESECTDTMNALRMQRPTFDQEEHGETLERIVSSSKFSASLENVARYDASREHMVTSLRHWVGRITKAILWLSKTLRRQTCKGYISMFSAFLVATNSIFLGIDEDANMKAALCASQANQGGCTHARNSAPFAIIRISFVAAYILELLAKILVYRCEFFARSELSWNLFDTVMIALSLIEEVMPWGGNFGAARAIRALKILRILRILRLFRQLRTLRLMLAMIGSAVAAMFWAFCFLSIIAYIGAIFFMGQLASGLAERQSTEWIEAVHRYYSSLGVTIITILGSISGGVDWLDVAAPLSDVSILAYMMYFGLVMFAFFALTNILTGIVCESTKKVGEVDRELVIQEEISNQKSFTNKMRSILYADEKEDNRLTEKRLLAHLTNPVINHYLHSLEVKPADALSVFRLLNVDNQGEVTVDDFIESLSYYHGDARHIDVATLLCENRNAMRGLHKFMAGMQDELMNLYGYLTTGRQPPPIDKPSLQKLLTQASLWTKPAANNKWLRKKASSSSLLQM